jgi:hypothetical protein
MTRFLALMLATTLAAQPAAAGTKVHNIGKVTHHAERFAGKTLDMTGYMLRRDQGYVLFSDEPDGKVTAHDLPVTGQGTDALASGVRYYLHGKFVKGGLDAANGNAYHLELDRAPSQTKP